MKHWITILFLGWTLVTWSQNPTAQFSASPTVQCVGAPITFSDLSVNGGSSIVQWVWDFGDGGTSTQQNPIYTYQSSGTYTVILTVTDASGSADFELKLNYITVNPKPTSTYSTSNNGCNLPVNVTYSNTSSGAIQYDWIFGDGQTSTLQNPGAITYTTAGNYQTSLIVTNTFGCKDTMDKVVSVSAFEAGIILPASGCVGTPLAIQDSSTAGANTWNWTLIGSNIGSSSSQNPNPIYNSPGTYTISLTSQNTVNGCSGSASEQITIYPQPNPSFDGGPTTGCAPLAVNFNNTSIPGSTFLWNFGDGTTYSGEIPPPHTYANNGSYNVSLTMTDINGCSSTSTAFNYINLTPPNVSFTADVTSGCDPLPVQFTANSSSADPITSWVWDFGDSTTFNGETPPVHSYNQGVYDVSLTVTTQSGCIATYTLTDYIRTGRVDSINFISTPPIQCAKTDVLFTDQTVISTPHDPSEVQYFWDFGDGGTSDQQNPSYNYPADTGFFDVTLVVAFRGCFDTLVKPDLQYILAPISRFTPSETLFCNPTSLPVTIQVADNSIIGTWPDDAEMYWSWGDGDTTHFEDPDFDDGDLGSTSHTYSAYGTYTIMQTIYNHTTGCADSTTVIIDVTETNAAISTSNDSICIGSSLNLISNATSTHPFGTYIWQTGDGGTEFGQQTTHTYWTAGTYTITHIATNNVGCSDTAIFTPVTALSLPSAGITPNDLAGCAPFPVTYSNLSSVTGNGVPLSYFNFHFPDDNTTVTTEQLADQVSHTFNTNGTFYVSIVAVDTFGCVSPPAYSSIAVTKPNASFIADNVICEHEVVQAFNTSSGVNPLTYQWFLDGNQVGTALDYSTSFDEPTFPLASNHSHTFQLITTDVNGCKDTAQQTVTVSTPMADFDYLLDGAATNSNGDFVCPPVFVDFTDQSINYGGISHWQWNFGDGKSSVFQSPNNTYVFAGTYTASLTITDVYGCTDDTVLVDYLTIFGPSASPSWTEFTNTCGKYASFDIGVTDHVSDILWNMDDGSLVNDSTTFTHLYSAVGTYDPFVTISDSNNCTVNYPLGPIALNVSPQLDITIQGDAIACFGDGDGNVSGSVTGGIAPYIVTLLETGAVQTILSDGGTFDFAQDISTLAAGNSTYHVSVTDANYTPQYPGCSTISAFVNMQEPNPIQLSGIPTNILCHGASTGAINISVTGGTGPYNYSWSNGSISEDLSLIPAGTYTLNLTDFNGNSNGCAASTSFTLTQPTAVALSSVQQDVLCNGASTGSIDLSVSGGTAPYTYSWSTGSTAQDISNLAAGTYSVTVRDAAGNHHGCTASSSITITQPTAVTLSQTHQDILCNGLSTGSIDLTVSGGTAPYTYSWSNGSTTQDISSLPAGAYSVTVNDNNGTTFGCRATLNVTLTQPTPVALANTIQHVRCNGELTGAINLTASGGTAPYSYSWSNTEITEDIDSLAAGTYTVTVHDANGTTGGCSATQTITITQPTALALAQSVTHVLCNGASTGSIDITPSGGTAPYFYSWSTGAITQDISSLAAGNYSVTTHDNNGTTGGCTATLNFTITQPNALAISSTKTDILCHSAATGAVDITVTGGVQPYTYTWSNGAVSQDLSGLVAGTYNLSVHDANGTTFGCQSTTAVTINQPTDLVLTFTQQHVLCNGQQTGAIDLTVNGGTAPYTYTWSNGANSQDITTLAAGNYSVQVHDANGNSFGCIDSAAFTITQPAPLNLTANLTQILCNGASTGAIDVTPSGGTTPYSYDWSMDGTGDVDDIQDQNNLAAATYSLTLHDVNSTTTGCVYTQNYTLTQPTAVQITSIVTPITCNGGNDGAINISISGGVSPYTIDWNTDQRGDFDDAEDLTNLNAGVYSIVVKDNNGSSYGCIDSTAFTLINPAGMNITLTPQIYAGGFNVTSCRNDGSILADITGGTQPYSFDWDNDGWGDNNDTKDLNALDSGYYQLIVTDINGCQESDSIRLNKAPQLFILQLQAALKNGGHHISCNGGSDGSIAFAVQGGVAPYAYTWTGPPTAIIGITNQNQQNIPAGTYTVTTMDQHGCEIDSVITLTEPPPLQIQAQGDSLLCYGDADGLISGNIAGGTAPYTVILTSNGSPFNVPNPGGSFNYNGLSGANQGGTNYYTIIAHDANGSTGGCAISIDSIPIYEPPPLTITMTASTYFGGINVVECLTNGIVTTIASGGTAPYTFDYSTNGYNGFTDSNPIQGLGAGTTHVMVKDNKGCVFSDSILLTTSPPLVVSTISSPIKLSGVAISCFGGQDGSIDLTANGGVGPYTYLWTSNKPIHHPTQKDIDSLYHGTYSVVITDQNGCTTDTNIILNQPTPIVGSFTIEDAQCFNTSTGSISTTISGGTPQYAYTWNGPGGFASISANLNNLPAGSYTLSLHDQAGNAGGCFFDTTIVVSEPPPTAITIDTLGATSFCTGDSVIFSVNMASNYLWSTGDTTQSITVFSSGTFEVSIIDSNGCSANSGIFTALAFPNPQIDAGPDQSICLGDSVILSCSGATNYTWSSNVVDGIFFHPQQTATYSVLATTDLGCMSVDSVTVMVNALPIVFAGNDLTICEGESVLLTASGAPSFTWDNGVIDSQPFIPIVGTHTYSVVGVTEFGCTDEDNLIVTVNPLPTLDLIFTPLQGCIPQTFTIQNQGSNATSCLWSLSNGMTSSSCSSATFTITEPGCYDITYTASNNQGCTRNVMEENVVCLEGYPTAAFKATDTELTTINTSVLFTNESIGASNYLWDFGDNTGTQNTVDVSHNFPDVPGYYLVTLIATSSYGCADTTYNYIEIEQEQVYYVPNTFTPNGDIFNNTFKPIFSDGYNPYNYVLYIFNRWGQLIFESHDPEVGWDGSYGSNQEIDMVQDGTYTWKIEFMLENSNETKTLIGHVNVLR